MPLGGDARSSCNLRFTISCTSFKATRLITCINSSTSKFLLVEAPVPTAQLLPTVSLLPPHLPRHLQTDTSTRPPCLPLRCTLQAANHHHHRSMATHPRLNPSTLHTHNKPIYSRCCSRTPLPRAAAEGAHRLRLRPRLHRSARPQEPIHQICCRLDICWTVGEREPGCIPQTQGWMVIVEAGRMVGSA